MIPFCEKQKAQDLMVLLLKIYRLTHGLDFYLLSYKFAETISSSKLFLFDASSPSMDEAVIIDHPLTRIKEEIAVSLDPSPSVVALKG